jgi:hypothetical protein
MGRGAVGVMRFSGDRCTLRQLSCRQPLYFVVGDLKAAKDTVVILRELSRCFPTPANDQQVSS